MLDGSEIFFKDIIRKREKCEVLKKIFKTTNIYVAKKLDIMKACQLFNKDPNEISKPALQHPQLSHAWLIHAWLKAK